MSTLRDCVQCVCAVDGGGKLHFWPHSGGYIGLSGFVHTCILPFCFAICVDLRGTC